MNDARQVAAEAAPAGLSPAEKRKRALRKAAEQHTKLEKAVTDVTEKAV